MPAKSRCEALLGCHRMPPYRPGKACLYRLFPISGRPSHWIERRCRIAMDVRAEIVIPPASWSNRLPLPTDRARLARAPSPVCSVAAGGESASINLVLRSDVVGSNPVAINLSASNETQVSNNSGQATIAIEPEVDLGVALRAAVSVSNGSANGASVTGSAALVASTSGFRLESIAVM